MHRIFLAFRIFSSCYLKRRLPKGRSIAGWSATGRRPGAAATQATPGAQGPGPQRCHNALGRTAREARLVDFIQESLAGYSDAQIGAVARDVHRDSAAVLNRLFALKPAVDAGGRQRGESAHGFRRRTLPPYRQCNRRTAAHGSFGPSRLGGDEMRIAYLDRQQRFGPSRRPRRSRNKINDEGLMTNDKGMTKSE